MRPTEAHPNPLRTVLGATLLAPLLLALLLVGCERGAQTHVKVEPASIEVVEDTGLNRLTLTERAIERTGVETVEIGAFGSGGLAVPYSAVIYGLHGETWAYTNPEPRLFVRVPIAVDRIEGDVAHLSEALDPATIVVSVGAAELYGTETGVGK